MSGNDKNGNLLGELKACIKCKNPFMAKQKQQVCDNCIKLEKLKQELSQGVNSWKIKLEGSIKEMETEVKQIQSKKEIFLERIKKRSALVNKSIDLLKKINESQDEKYIEEYKALFEEMKKEGS
ncbi:MAG: hypothetical protein JW891_03065 [Candidatus Lokiarchaeota archaeon]|nr:hypothetical protein [Candidatus Lokiarchaeota archaeon]